MEAAIFDDLTRAGRRHAQPHAAGARAPRADGLGALRRAAAAAIDGQPPPENAPRRRLGRLAPRRHEPLLHAGARRARAGDAPALGAPSRAGEPDARRRPGRPAAARRAGRRQTQVAGVLRVGGGAVGPPARGSVRPGLVSARAARDCSTPSGSSATSAAAPARWPRRSRRSSSRSSPSIGRATCSRPRAAGFSDLPNVDVRRGELEALPIQDGELDAATLLLVLHHLPDPVEALPKPRACCDRAAGCSSPTCCRTIARRTASRWATSGSDSAKTRCRSCSEPPGSIRSRIASMPTDPDAKGPALFVAGATESHAESLKSDV